ncbi:hypothetical protein DFH09DRAFT_1086945 [Mycena vulgaris]|nr:hypothetical protein DFH09DRAFT_1086945 [Mycena vulgaris]
MSMYLHPTIVVATVASFQPSRITHSGIGIVPYSRFFPLLRLSSTRLIPPPRSRSRMPPYRPPSPSSSSSNARENDEDMTRSSPAAGAEAEAVHDKESGLRSRHPRRRLAYAHHAHSAYAGEVARAGGRCEKKWSWRFSGTTDERHGQSHQPSAVPRYSSLPSPSALSLPSRSLCLMFLCPRSGLRHGNRHSV